MIQATRKNQTSLRFRGVTYQIHKNFPSALAAKRDAAAMRNAPYPNTPGNYRCRVVVVDFGAEAGRLRYATFIARGAKINK